MACFGRRSAVSAKALWTKHENGFSQWHLPQLLSLTVAISKQSRFKTKIRVQRSSKLTGLRPDKVASGAVYLDGKAKNATRALRIAVFNN